MAASFTTSFVSLVLICTAFIVLLICIVRNNDYNLRSTSQTRSVEADSNVASVSHDYHSKDHDEDHDKHRGDIFDYNQEMELKTSM